MILAVMKAIYGILYIEAWKSKDLNGVWTRDLAIPLRRSNQLSYEATDVGSWSFVDPKEPVRNECEVIIWNISYIELEMWNQVSYYTCTYESNLCNFLYRSLKKSGVQWGLNPWSHDTFATL
mgnify:CR=1 FL=1